MTNNDNAGLYRWLDNLVTDVGREKRTLSGALFWQKRNRDAREYFASLFLCTL
jgi:hypothetical protein